MFLGLGLVVVVIYLLVPRSPPSRWGEPGAIPPARDAGVHVHPTRLDRIEAIAEPPVEPVEPLTPEQIAAESRTARVRELRRAIEDAVERGDEDRAAALRAELARLEGF